MGEKLTLYTTGCPRCNVLTKKLDAKHLEYSTCRDEGIMQELGFTSAPMLQVNDKLLTFGEAIAWLNAI